MHPPPPPHIEKMTTKGEASPPPPNKKKKIIKRRTSALQMEKRSPLEWENDPAQIELIWDERLLLPPPPFRVLMSKCDYIMHNIFGNYSSHNYIKIRSTLHPIISLKISRKSIYP